MQNTLDDVLRSVLSPFAVYAVGGRVRDELRSRIEHVIIPAKDLDYVVAGLEQEQVAERLRKVGRVDAVGASFAVLKFRCDAGEADIALPRRERSTGSGHRDFVVESRSDIPIEDDLARRDFRMNMIARRLDDNALIDPFGGVRDIEARRIDIISDQTFLEDPLRLLRAAQFSARFDFQATERTRAAMAAAAALVTTVSPERVGDEMTKLLNLAPKPSVGLELLRETGVLGHLWPELVEGVGVDQNEWHAFDVYRHNLVTLDATPAGDLILRLAALLHDVAKPRTKDGPHFYRHEQVGADLIPSMLDRLRFPTGVTKEVAHLVRQHMYTADPGLAPKAIRRFIHRIGVDGLPRLFALRGADIVGSGLPKRDDTNERFEALVFEVVSQAPAASVRDLAIDGRDVIEILVRGGFVQAGFAGDRRVGQILTALFERVTDEPELNNRAALLEMADTLASEAGGSMNTEPGSTAKQGRAASERT